MKNTVLFLTLAFLMAACKPPKSSVSTKDISVAEAMVLIENTPDLLILDVRTPEEWKLGAIEGATKLNFHDADFADKVSQLEKNRPMLVYCKAGGRSAKSTTVLENAGFKSIYNMLGGYDAYNSK